MQEAIREMVDIVENGPKVKAHGDELRALATKLAVFHVENCKDALLRKALTVVAAICDYADELEK